MGIQGLLPLLKSIMVPIHIKDLEGCSVAVDTYSWLHKGALSCSRELCKGLPTSRHIDYCMRRVNLLRHYGVKPILVFDGGLLPMKIEQENKRARARKENLERAIEHESDGNSAAAYECYQKAVDISPSIAHELIQVLKQENVCYVVAPYEADAQMTFLAVSKQVDAVVTEDSDLIPFGCPRIIFKMDKFGQGVEFQDSKLHKNKELSFKGFTKQMLLEMCILSGCDYLQSLSGMGIKRAHSLISKFKSYDKVIKHLRYSTVSVPPLYEESFKKAIFTFQHQRVYDPITEDIVHLSNIFDNLADDLEFLGPLIPKDIAKGIAKGDLDPFTQRPFQGEHVSSQLVLKSNSNLKSFQPQSQRKKLDLPVQKNLLTKYFCFASLEAKRKFRAPRTSPKHPSPTDKCSNSPEEPATMEAASCEANGSLAFLLDSENSGQVENDTAPEVSECSESLSHDKDVVPGRIDLEATLPLQSGNSLHNSCLASHKEPSSNNIADVVEGKTRIEIRKAVVRSSYFQHKQVSKNHQDDKQGKLFLNDDAAIDVPERIASRNSYLEGLTQKRKAPQDDIFHNENANPKQIRTDASLHASAVGYHDPDHDKNLTESKPEEGKFGANISHLSHYSDIAEKSMERFVSVISSFRFSSSGSRASGLRAPLKDIRNTCPKRSSNEVDFGKFAYLPSNGETAVTSRRL